MRRPLFLTGFMATGKSTIARKVADLSGRPYVDLDQQIEREAGVPVAQIFAERGEAEFRALERRCLAVELERREPAVVALGGGALLQRSVRLDVLDRAVLVVLEASAAEIVQRVGNAGSRPLLAGPDPLTRAQELLELRAPGYAEAHARLSTERRSPAELAQAVLAIWREDPLAVGAGEQSYAVEIGAGLIGRRLAAVAGSPSRVVLVSDQNVHGLHGAKASSALSNHTVETVVPEPGEENKHIGSIEPIWRAALASGADRKSLFVGLGGGVVTDMTGFAAATYMRGVPWIGVPSTLLAMVDASVGGKTGVDLGSAKNAVGAFHQPRHVLCDVELLQTETPRAYRSAIAEVVKTALIGDPSLLDLLETEHEAVLARSAEVVTEIVRRSIRVKARIVSEDQREQGKRAWLNLGHTVGHALESVGGYNRWLHGEAISLGLVAALGIGRALNKTPADLLARTQRVLELYQLPVSLKDEPLEAASRLIGHDKKRGGSKLRFVFAHAPGHVETEDLPLSQVEELTRGLA